MEGERRTSGRSARIRAMLKGYKPRIETALPSDNTRVVRPVAEREVVLRKAGRGTGRAVAVTRADVSRAIEEAVAEAAVERDGVSKGVAKLEEVLAAERKAAEEWRRRGGASIGPAQSSRERYIVVLPRLDFLYEGEVFGEGEYHGLKLSKRDWAWAGLRLDLKGMKGRVPEYEVESGWNSQLGRSEYVAGGDVIGNSVQIVKALKEYGVSEADKDLAREELAGMLKVKGLCEDKRGGIKIGDVDGKHVRGDYEYNLRTVPLCQFSLDVMEGLGVLAVQHKDKKAVDEIYNYMVAKHREGLGPMVVYQGAALLMGINSQYSYGKLKEFLKERAHQTTGGKILSSLSYLSFEGLSRGVQEGSSEGKHLNGYTARYGYLDRETAEGYNPNLAINIVTAQPLTSDGKYQLPMGNVYEDIGAMLAADAMKNGKSAALASDILKSSGYEWPLVSGVLLGEKGKYAYKALGSNAVKMWRGLLAADYADMNEGTQRRMKSRAAVALETSGAVSGAEVAQYKAKDEGKFARYSRQEKVNFGLGALDILVIVVTLPLLVKGVAQGSVKVVSKLRNFGQFSARMARNGAQSLRTVPGKVASGVREVKAAAGKVVTKVKETPARVRAAAAERKAAVAAQESAAARRAEEAAVEVAQAEREVARELARMEQSGSINTAKYKPAVVYNALGQARMGWVPAEPVNAAKPSLWKNFLEGSKSWGSNFAYEAGQMFGDMGRALKRQTGFAVMALGMNLTPLPGTALQGLARAESALGNVVRTEQVMTAAPVMAAGKTAPFVVGSLDAVRSVSPTVNNVVKASMLPGVPVSAAGSSVPWSASLMFPAVAVTPTEERRLGLGNFFKFKVGKPQFLNNYFNEQARYNRLLSFNGQDPQQVAFQELQQRKMQYTLNQNATQLYWQRAGYPLTGTIQSRLAGAWEGNYLYNIAPWVYRNNPYYLADVQATNQRAEQAQEETPQIQLSSSQETYSGIFRHGVIDEQSLQIFVNNFVKAHYPRETGLILSANGLGEITEKANRNVKIKQASDEIFRLTMTAAHLAGKEAIKLARALTAEDYAVLFNKYVVQELNESTELTPAFKKELQKAFEDELKKANKAGMLEGDAVRVELPKDLRKHFGGRPSTVVSFYTVRYNGKDYRLAEQYHFIRTESQYKVNIPLAIEKSNLIAQRILKEKSPARSSLIWILSSAADEVHKLQAYFRMEAMGYALPMPKEVAAAHSGLNENPNLRVELTDEEEASLSKMAQLAVRENESLLNMVPPSERLLSSSYDPSDLLRIDSKKLNSVLYAAQDVRPVINPEETLDARGNAIYHNYLPVYLRYEDGTLSSQPMIYLTVNSKKGFPVPRGFVVAVDEIGQWKYVPVNLRQIQSASKVSNFIDKIWGVRKVLRAPYNPAKMLRWDSKKRHIPMEVNLKTSELQALMAQLGKNEDKYVAVIDSMPEDQFDSMMFKVALVAGSDLGASLSSQFKGTFAGSVIQNALSIFISGFGYISPLIANLFKPLITKFGHFQTLRFGLSAMAAVSLYGVFNGMYGFYDIPHNANIWAWLPVISFLTVAITVASVFSTIAGPILKSAYPNKVVFASRNLSFTTTKGLSRLAVSALPYFFMKILEKDTVKGFFENTLNLPITQDLNWSMLTPVVLGLSIWALWNLQHSRLKSEDKVRMAEQKKKAEASTVTKEELKQRNQERKVFFKKIFGPQMKSITGRLGKIYMAYAPINSVMIGIVAGILWGKEGLLVSIIGNGVNFAARKIFNKMLKNRYISDDQLTGLLLPVMAGSIAALFLTPYKIGLLALPWLLMYASTSTFGVAENTRLMNLVASYYKKQRDQVRADKKLSVEEQQSRISTLKEDETDMKMRAANVYNRYNSMGVLTILGIIAGTILFKEGGQLSVFMAPVLDFLSNLMPWNKAVGTEAQLLDIFRWMLLPSLIFGGLLVGQNWGMVKAGWKHIMHPTRRLETKDILSQDNQKILDKLEIDLSHIQSTKEMLFDETQEMVDITRGYATSLMSEKHVAELVGRAIWINNRIKALVDNIPDGGNTMKEELMNLRIIAYNLREILKGDGVRTEDNHLNGNDISSVLRQEAEGLFQSVEGIKFVTDDISKEFLALLAELRTQNSDNTTIQTLTIRLEESLHNMDADNFDKALAVLVEQTAETNYSKELENKGGWIGELMRQELPAVVAADIQYLQENKKKERIDASHYEQALAYEKEMHTIRDEYQRGNIYDGILEDYQLYYQRAMRELEKYQSKNKSFFRGSEEERVKVFRARLQRDYDNFFGSVVSQKNNMPSQPPASTPAY